jgi:hypothetical protein
MPQPKQPTTDADVMEKDGRRYRRRTVRTAGPIWIAAAVWPLAALLFPPSKPIHIVWIALASLGAGLLADRLIPREERWEEICSSSGNAELDDVAARLAEEADALELSRAAVADAFPDAAARLGSIAGTCLRIRQALLESPEDLPKVRRFLNYYLPVTQKLADKYVRVRREKEPTDNLRQIAADVEQALDAIDPAFVRQYDALFSDDALDISTDIAVLETMLARDGLN